MTRTELIQALADETGTDRKLAKAMLEGLTSIIEGQIRAGGEVPLKGLGKFKVQHRQARVGRNPATGEAIQIPAMTVPTFKAGKGLKDRVRT